MFDPPEEDMEHEDASINKVELSDKDCDDTAFNCRNIFPNLTHKVAIVTDCNYKDLREIALRR